MSTPRTDAIAHAGLAADFLIAALVPLCRQLERELQAERKISEYYSRARVMKVGDEGELPNPIDEPDADDADEEDAQADGYFASRLKDPTL